MVEVQSFGTGTRYGLEILHQCGKRIKTKIQKALRIKSSVCRSYRGKTGWREGGGEDKHLQVFQLIAKDLTFLGSLRKL